jgi:hypothetical protein
MPIYANTYKFLMFSLQFLINSLFFPLFCPDLLVFVVVLIRTRHREGVLTRYAGRILPTNLPELSPKGVAPPLTAEKGSNHSSLGKPRNALVNLGCFLVIVLYYKPRDQEEE